MKDQKKNKPLVILIVVLAVVLVALVVLLAVLQNNRGGNDPVAQSGSSDTAASAQTAETTDPDETVLDSDTEDIAIETPYCTLYYPGDWADFLDVEKTEGEQYAVSFRAVLSEELTQDLFTITFGGSTEDAIGLVQTGEDSAAVHVEVAPFRADESWTNSNINIVYAMQDALNDVLYKMPLEEIDQSGESGQNTAGGSEPDSQDVSLEDMAIGTPYGELHYPARWADNLSIETSEDGDVYTLSFYCKVGQHDQELLFTLHFGGSEGSQVGAVRGTNGENVAILLSVSELALDDTWTEEEADIAYAMQEDLNYLLENL